MRCIRTKDLSFSYGYRMKNGITGELYDLNNDPRQQYNLYDEKSHLKVRNEYLQKLLDFQLEHGYMLNRDRPYLGPKRPISRGVY